MNDDDRVRSRTLPTPSGHAPASTLALAHAPAVCRFAPALFAALAVALSPSCAAQDLSVSVLFGENSVWQRDLPVRLRGTAAPGAEVSFRSDRLGRANAVADGGGLWTLSLPASAAGGPYAYTLESAGQTKRYGDVYVGDVFLCSGQSNMEWPVANTDDRERATALTDPLLHHIVIPHASASAPQAEPEDTFWQSAYPGRTEGFTAIGYYFAEELRRRNPEVPIGIINASWGGSVIEAWLANAEPAPESSAVADRHRARWAELRRLYPAAFATGGPGAGNAPERRLDPHGTDGAPIELGTLWESRGFPEVDGTMWFDREFSLSARQITGDTALLALGPIDDADETYVNGQLVGSTDLYSEPRYYPVPAAILRPGRNRLSVRVEDDGGGGGFGAPKDSLYFDTGIGRIRLGDAGWRVRPERIYYDSIGSPHTRPRQLYNGMLHPLTGVKARGVLWYQGESNATGPTQTARYHDQIAELVGQFRALTAQPDLPFVAVELPGWLAPSRDNHQADAHWAQMRQAIRAVTALPNTGTVVALGYGDIEDIHPKNKRPVALMLAEEMARLAYGSETEPRNSWPAQLREQGPGALVVDFSDVGEGGLKTTDGEAPRGFAVRDAGGQWHYANARIVAEDAVRLTVPSGKTITAVAYAWSNFPDEANLVNGYGRRVGSWEKAVVE